MPVAAANEESTDASACLHLMASRSVQESCGKKAVSDELANGPPAQTIAHKKFDDRGDVEPLGWFDAVDLAMRGRRERLGLF